MTENRRASYELSQARDVVTRTIRLSADKQIIQRVCVEGNDLPGDAQSVFDQVFLRKRDWRIRGERRPAVRSADLFCGCGGLSLGLREAASAVDRAVEFVLAVDQNAASLNVYQDNFAPEHALQLDIRSVLTGDLGTPASNREIEFRAMAGRVDVLLAGPPCQGHSDLNNHTRRQDIRNKLYERVARFAEIVRPTYILVENVPAIVHSYEDTLCITIKHLSRLGYFTDSGTVNLLDLGVPQNRKRHVLVASLDNARHPKIDDVIAKHKVDQTRDLQWAIQDLEMELGDNPFTSASRYSADNQRRIEYLHRNGLYELPNHMRPPCHQNGHTYKSVYGRLNYSEPAQTITGGFSCPGQGRYVHPTQTRTLTPHEAARLQFFPDSFDFSSVSSRTALATMIGNAVPMKLAYAFSMEYLA